MTDARQDKATDAPKRSDNEPEAESGAGYGNHAPAPEDQHEDETKA